MILTRDLKFTSDMLMELVLKFRDTDHLDELNEFVDNEKIQTLSMDDLKKRLEKSLGINVQTLEKVLNEDLERKSLVMIASLAIEIANKVPSMTTTPKRKSNETTSSGTKKQKDDIDDDKSQGKIVYDDQTLNDRIVQLETLTGSTKYAKQKRSLQTDISDFLASLDPPKTLSDATPHDVRLFIAFKDLNGNTIIHSQACQSSMPKPQACDCPRRRSAGSIDSLIGQTRAIFRDHGRRSEWFLALGVGNPAASPLIKQYLSAVRLEQSKVAVFPKQAVPLLFDKLTLILRHLDYCQSNPLLTVHTRYIYLRDMAFLNLLAHTGDRAGNLGQLLSSQINYLPSNEDISLRLCTGKTVSVSNPRSVIVHRSLSKEFCPIKVLEQYTSFCKNVEFVLRDGYLFRPLSPKLIPLNKPFSSPCLNERLKRYLIELSMFEGETPHGSRSGCALTLAWLGVDRDGIKCHVGWKSDKMLDHYTHVHATAKGMKTAKILSECSDSIAKDIRMHVEHEEGRAFIV